MGELNQTTTLEQDTQHPASRMMEFSELQRNVRLAFDNFEHWLICIDESTKCFIDQVARRFYAGAGADDFSVYVCLWKGNLFGVAVLRKRRMLVHQLRWELKKYGVSLSESELDARDCLIVASPANLILATSFLDVALDHGRPLDHPRVPMNSSPIYDGVMPSMN